MSVIVEPAHPGDPDVIAMVAAHKAHCRAVSPPESCHAIEASAFEEAGVAVWVVRLDGAVTGIGALKMLGPGEGEIKTMHTLAAARGKGVGAAILRAIMDEARRRGYHRLSLETGTQDAFNAARTLYERHGFQPCPPFGAYLLDPNSAFYTIRLDPPGGTL